MLAVLLASLLHRQFPALACTKLRSKAQGRSHQKAMCFPVAMRDSGKRALATHTDAQPSAKLITARKQHARPSTTATVTRRYRPGIIIDSRRRKTGRSKTCREKCCCCRVRCWSYTVRVIGAYLYSTAHTARTSYFIPSESEARRRSSQHVHMPSFLLYCRSTLLYGLRG